MRNPFKKNTSYKIVDGKIPSDLNEILEEIRAASKLQKVDWEKAGLSLEAPWEQFPSHEMHSIGWRMGPGEDFMIYFRNWYSNLSSADKNSYQLLHPEPGNWAGYYNRIDS